MDTRPLINTDCSVCSLVLSSMFYVLILVLLVPIKSIFSMLSPSGPNLLDIDSLYSLHFVSMENISTAANELTSIIVSSPVLVTSTLTDLWHSPNWCNILWQGYSNDNTALSLIGCGFWIKHSLSLTLGPACCCYRNIWGEEVCVCASVCECTTVTERDFKEDRRALPNELSV